MLTRRSAVVSFALATGLFCCLAQAGSDPAQAAGRPAPAKPLPADFPA